MQFFPLTATLCLSLDQNDKNLDQSKLAGFCGSCRDNLTTQNLKVSDPEDRILSLSQILDSSKLKELADDNFKFDENGRKLSKWVENTVGKAEIACYKQFLFLPQCFQRTCTADMHIKTRACLGKG